MRCNFRLVLPLAAGLLGVCAIFYPVACATKERPPIKIDVTEIGRKISDDGEIAILIHRVIVENGTVVGDSEVQGRSAGLQWMKDHPEFIRVRVEFLHHSHQQNTAYFVSCYARVTKKES